MENGNDIEAIYLDEALLLPGDKERFVEEMRKAMNKSPVYIRPLYAQDTHVVRTRIDVAPKTINGIPSWVLAAMPDGVIYGEHKPYRVFFHAGAFEWYVNTGRAPLWEYRKRGKLVGAYNIYARICAPFAAQK